MNRLNIFANSCILCSFAIVSCKEEVQPEATKQALTLQDFAMDQEAEDAAAAQSETIAEAQKMKDDINAKTKASEENAEKLNQILQGK